MSKIDIVICVGPFDAKLIKELTINIKQYVMHINKIYLIMPTNILDKYRVYDPIVENIDENIFPFNKQYIDDKFKYPKRSGWYLQQLLKIYAPIIITQILDNYVIIDADIKFFKPIGFFKNNKMLLNIEESHHTPYFTHMNKLYNGLIKKTKYSGITNLMPMKRHIITSLINIVEQTHHKTFWEVFLDMVEQNMYNFSGASEYEILFNYSLIFFENECEIQRISFHNVEQFMYNSGDVYQACHHYARK